MAVFCLFVIGLLILPFGVLINNTVKTVSDKEQLKELMSENMITDDALPKLIKKSLAYITVYEEYPDKMEIRLMQSMFSGVGNEEMTKIFAYIIPEKERLRL